MHPYTATEIVEYAANHNIKIMRGGVSMESDRVGDRPIACCARGVIRHMYGFDKSMYEQEFLDKTNLSKVEAEGLEAGFEGMIFCPHIYNYYYYQVGQEVARLVGY